MNQKGQYLIMSVATISIISLGVVSVLLLNNDRIESDSRTVIHNLYAKEQIPLEYQKDHAQDMVHGIITDKSYIHQYRDAEGNYLSRESNLAEVIEQFIVYELNVKKSIKSQDNTTFSKSLEEILTEMSFYLMFQNIK